MCGYESKQLLEPMFFWRILFSNDQINRLEWFSINRTTFYLLLTLLSIDFDFAYMLPYTLIVYFRSNTFSKNIHPKLVLESCINRRSVGIRVLRYRYY